MANTRDLTVRINGDTSGLEKALGKADKSSGGLAAAFQKAELTIPAAETKESATTSAAPDVPSFLGKQNQQEDLSPSEVKKKSIQQFCREALNYFNQGDLEKAVENFKKALRVDPTYLPARNNLALIYERNPQWHAAAIEEWNTIMTLADELNEAKYKERAEKKLAQLREKNV